MLPGSAQWFSTFCNLVDSELFKLLPVPFENYRLTLVVYQLPIKLGYNELKPAKFVRYDRVAV